MVVDKTPTPGKAGKIGKVHKLKPKKETPEEITKGQPEQQEFEGMETPRNPKLELKAKEIAKRETIVKKTNLEIKTLKDEALLIMKDFELRHYHKYGVHLDLEAKEELKVSVD